MNFKNVINNQKGMFTEDVITILSIVLVTAMLGFLYAANVKEEMISDIETYGVQTMEFPLRNLTRVYE